MNEELEGRSAPDLLAQEPAANVAHDPCCSSHGVPMTCEYYRRTHFVEVRPCCSEDAARLAAERVS